MGGAAESVGFGGADRNIDERKMGREKKMRGNENGLWWGGTRDDVVEPLSFAMKL